MSAWLRKPLLLFTIAFVARAVFVLVEPPTRRVDDEPVWIALGQELAGVGFSPWKSDQVFHPPLYPYFLGGLGTFFGSLEAVKWTQVVLGSLLSPLLFRLGERAWGERVGLVAGGFAALYPELVWYCAHFWSEIVFVTLLWAGFERLLAGDEESRSATVAAGLLWGLAALTRETVLFFLPLAALWLAAGEKSGRRRAGAFLLAAAAVIAPWTLRNLAVTGAFVPVATRGSFNLWLANTERPWDEVYAAQQTVEGGPIAQERHARREAWAAILGRQPRWLFEKLAHEMPAFFGVNDQIVVHLERRAYKRMPIWVNRSVALATVLPYLAVLVLAVPALASVGRDRASVLLVGFLFFYLCLHVVAFASPRFRLPVLPLLFLFAARTIDRGLMASWRGLSRGRLGLAMILAGALGLGVALSVAETLRHPAFGASVAQGDSE